MSYMEYISRHDMGEAWVSTEGVGTGNLLVFVRRGRIGGQARVQGLGFRV
jgi:hypothetical protein